MMRRMQVVSITVLAVAASVHLILPGDPNAQDLLKAFEGPSLPHPFGFDHLGRDVFLRVAHAAPRSLGLAALCVVFAYVVGIALGMIAAYRGGFVEAALMRLVDLLLAFPGILLALLLAGFLGAGPGPILLGISLGLMPQFARLSRATAGQVLAEPHVEAAEMAGFRTTAILRRHVLLPVIRSTLPIGILSIGGAILSVSSLGFLGLGIRPPTPEWGAMISEMMPYISEAPVQLAAPCIAIFLSVLAFAHLFTTERSTAVAGRPS
ncbi:ABC transporter permease [Mesorhizobium sp. CGMCC 1.15528]|uniref:ABC transporter permease n=1 Tax=Mesorhizobium zhangyense TaxID=1776730 RepID=A0A7C9RA80_9HYPH|nr:ABC transporter permease [Mesorhizobium zhangyense]NGN43882.1 ABC transporter permease [Mesorhizobium zhangyense]